MPKLDGVDVLKNDHEDINLKDDPYFKDAPDGQVYVCGACGKTSPNRAPGTKGASRGWDESCMLNSFLCYIDGIERDDKGQIRKVRPVKETTDTYK